MGAAAFPVSYCHQEGTSWPLVVALYTDCCPKADRIWVGKVVDPFCLFRHSSGWDRSSSACYSLPSLGCSKGCSSSCLAVVPYRVADLFYSLTCLLAGWGGT